MGWYLFDIPGITPFYLEDVQMCCECDDDCDYDFNWSWNRKEDKMKQSYFAAGSSYATEDEAISAAKKRSAKYFEDVNIYKAYKVAKTTTPNVEVTDITV